MARSEEELKSLLMRVKEESEKAGLKLSIQKAKITASGPITSWQIDEERVQTVTDFLFLGSKITEDDYWSYEIKTLAPLSEPPPSSPLELSIGRLPHSPLPTLPG